MLCGEWGCARTSARESGPGAKTSCSDFGAIEPLTDGRSGVGRLHCAPRMEGMLEWPWLHANATCRRAYTSSLSSPSGYCCSDSNRLRETMYEDGGNTVVL